MDSVPMPRDLSEEAVRKWIRAVSDCDVPAHNCRSCLNTARAVRALVEAKVREAVCAGDVTDVLDEDRADAIVARVLGEEAPRA